MYTPLSNWRHDTVARGPDSDSATSSLAWVAGPIENPNYLDFLVLEDGFTELFTETYLPFLLEDSTFTTTYKSELITGSSYNPHTLGSGPNHEGYVTVTFPETSITSYTWNTWGTSPLNKYKGLYFGVNDVGADLGTKTPGPPVNYDDIVFVSEGDSSFVFISESYSIFVCTNLWGTTTAWRQVPPAMDGYWTNYSDVDYDSLNSLNSYDGYRGLTTITIANAKVFTSFGPQYGLRTSGKYTYFGGNAPSSQPYTPYNTPDGNTSAQGYTGGGVTHGRMEGGILTNPTNDTSGSRASWVYNPPVYCRTFTETVRATSPGLMSTALRYVYRGKAASYVSNYASIYHQAPEGVRVMLHTFSPTVNSSNQKS